MNNIKIDNNEKLETGFVIPADYFDNLFDNVNYKINAKPKVIPFYLQPILWISAVASFFVIGFSILTINNNMIAADQTAETIAFEESLTIEEIAEQLTEKDIVSLQKTLQTEYL